MPTSKIPFLLLHFPTEILRLILSHLLDVDILTFINSRRTCKTFQTLATDILEKSSFEHGLAFHALLQSHFKPLIQSPPDPELPDNANLTRLTSYRQMPWASDPKRREKYLREEASWYYLPLASPDGTIMHKMQAVEVKLADLGSVGATSEVSCSDVRFWFSSKNDKDHPDYDGSYVDSIYMNPPQGVTIGWLYELIIVKHQYIKSYKLSGGWELFFKKRLRDEGPEWLEMNRYPSRWMRDGEVLESEVKECVTDDESCASLWVYRGLPSTVLPANDQPTTNLLTKKSKKNRQNETQCLEKEKVWDPERESIQRELDDYWKRPC